MVRCYLLELPSTFWFLNGSQTYNKIILLYLFLTFTHFCWKSFEPFSTIIGCVKIQCKTWLLHSYLNRKQRLFFLLQQDQITQFKGTHEQGVWLILTLVGLFPSQRNMTTTDLHLSTYISSQSFPSLTDFHQSFHTDTHTEKR